MTSSKPLTAIEFPLPELTGDRFPLPMNTGHVDGRTFPLAELTGHVDEPYAFLCSIDMVRCFAAAGPCLMECVANSFNTV